MTLPVLKIIWSSAALGMRCTLPAFALFILNPSSNPWYSLLNLLVFLEFVYDQSQWAGDRRLFGSQCARLLAASLYYLVCVYTADTAAIDSWAGYQLQLLLTVLATHASYHIRRWIGKKAQIGGSILGLLEDALALYCIYVSLVNTEKQ